MRRTMQVFVVLAALTSTASADLGNPHSQTIGVGARALAMGTNYAGLAGDFSALHYNPAGLGFVKAREAHVGLNGMIVRSESSQRDNTAEGSNERLHVSSAGIIWAVPTSRGGLALAAGYQNPYVYDESYSYRSTYTDSSFDFNYLSFGQLNLWTVGLGLQFAPGLSAGLAASLVTGSSEVSADGHFRIGGAVLDTAWDDYERTVSRTYIGYDIRVGVMYEFADFASIGARFVFPRKLRFGGTVEESYPLWPADSSYTADEPGVATATYEGALGGAVKLPFLILTPEVRFRSPDPSNTRDTDAAYWKLGAGIGAEAPVARTGLLVRAGYSYNEYDNQPFTVVYDEPAELSTQERTDVPAPKRVTNNQHTLSCGLAYLGSKALLVELSYGYTLWDYTLLAPNPDADVDMSQGLHQIMLSVALRY